MRSLRIGYDASFCPKQKSGTSVYSHNLLEALSKIDKKNNYLVFPFFQYHYLPNYKEYKPMLGSNFKMFCSKVPKIVTDILWKGIPEVKKLIVPEVDIFHSTTFTIPPFKFYKKLIFTVYDTTFYTHPQYHKVQNIEHCQGSTVRAVIEADAIIAISQSTKNDLIKYFDCPENKIVVTELACDEVFSKQVRKKLIDEIRNKYRLLKPFIFHLGSLEPRKNTLGLIKAYRLLPEKIQRKFDLVIGGGMGWLNDDVSEYLKRYNNDGRVKMLGYVEDADLPMIYKTAQCFAYPSFYEGFGIPILEAMASGYPVLTANNSSLPEICGPYAVYCQADSIVDIRDKLKLILSQDNSRLIANARKRAKNYSWIKTAQKTYNLYKEII